MDISNTCLWIGFGMGILVLLVLDFTVFQRKDHAIKITEAVLWTLVWVSVALLSNLTIYLLKGPQPALEYLTGNLIEKSPSAEYLFIFGVIFSAFLFFTGKTKRDPDIKAK